MNSKIAILGLIAGSIAGPALAAQSTQCVTNALAGGTPDAITIPLLPCALNTTLLLLTLTGTNTTTAPTLQMAGYPALPILTNQSSALPVGALPAGAVVQLSSTGSSWLLINNGSQFAGGTVTVPEGGTGDTSLTSHGVLYGNGTSAVGVTAAGTTGQVLAGSTGNAPTWAAASSLGVTSLSFGSLGLTPNSATQGAITVGGTLISANGGTGLSSYTVGDMLYASGTTTLSKLADAATGNALISGGVGVAPSWGKIALSTHVTGILPIANGGTGASSFTGSSVVKTDTLGTALLSAIAGLDYAKPSVDSTWTGKQSFTGSSSPVPVLAMSILNASEPGFNPGGAPGATINFDLFYGSIEYYTTNATTNFVVNFRGDSSTTLNSLMANFETVTVVLEIQQGATAYYNTAVQINGTTSGVTTQWQGGITPSAGNANSTDVYTYAIQKTGSSTFKVLASLTQFK